MSLERRVCVRSKCRRVRANPSGDRLIRAKSPKFPDAQPYFERGDGIMNAPALRRTAALFLALFLLTALMSVGGMAKSAASKPIKIGRVTSLAAKAESKTGVSLSWKAVENAEYQVYRSEGGNGAYKRIKTVSAPVCTDRKRVTGRSYSYKVRAFRVVNGEKVYGKFSAARRVEIPKPATTPLPAPESAATPALVPESTLVPSSVPGNDYDFVPGEVIVGLEKSAPFFETLLPGFEIAETRLLTPGTSRNVYLVKFAVKTKEIVLEAIEVLKQNSHVYAADLNYIGRWAC